MRESKPRGTNGGLVAHDPNRPAEVSLQAARGELWRPPAITVLKASIFTNNQTFGAGDGSSELRNLAS